MRHLLTTSETFVRCMAEVFFLIDCLVKIGMAPSISKDEYVRSDKCAETTWQVA